MENQIKEWAEAPLVFIGVDTGYHLIKTRNHIFSNGVMRFDGEPPLQTETIQVSSDECYAIGGERLTVMDDKTANEDYRVLTLAAIAKELQTRGTPTPVRVVLGVGVPFRRMNKEKDQLIEYLNYRRVYAYKYEGRWFKIRLEEVYCFPQCYAAIADRIPNMNGRYVVADIGSWTKDIIVLEDGRVKMDQCVTVPQSIITLYQDIRNAVMEETGTNIPESVVVNYIIGKDAVVSREVIDIMDRCLEKFADDTEGLLKEKGFDPEYAQVLYVGGGATILKNYGKKAPNIGYIEDIRMNAIGYEYLSEYQWNRGKH